MKRRANNKKKWYGVTMLFMESKRKRVTAFRIYTLVKAAGRGKAVDKAICIWKDAPHPHGHVHGARWEYVGPTRIYECYDAPVANGILGYCRAEGRTWKDALDYVVPESKFDLASTDWGKRPAPENLYCAHLVYFIRCNRKEKFGKITIYSCIVRCNKSSKILESVYATAVARRTMKLTTSVRPGFGKKCIVEFAGINDVTPVYRRIEDGMEFNRTVQTYKTKKAVRKLVPGRTKLLGTF